MKDTKIEWADSTWNPVTGCYHGCRYCYARKMAQRFGGYDKNCSALNKVKQIEFGGYKEYEVPQRMETLSKTGKKINAPYPFGFAPTLHDYRLDVPKKCNEPRNIFVCSMADLFGAFIPNEWLDKVFDACEKAPQHNYLFLTKNVKRYTEYGVPIADNMWYGATITVEDEMKFIDSLPSECNTFISIEPLLGDVHPENRRGILRLVDWVILGAETGKSAGKITAKKEWIDKIVTVCKEKKKPVFMKESLLPIMGEENMIREFPKGLCK